MDETTRLLLTAMAGGSSGGLSMADILQQSMGDDPAVLPIVAALREREAREAADDDDEDGTPADPEVAELLERLYAEVETLRERTGMLADALGACRRCFGDEELCPVCRGRGRPGGRAPDPVLFADLVEPAWRRFGGTTPVLAAVLDPEPEVIRH